MFGRLIEKLKRGLARTRDAFLGIADLFRGRGRVDKTFLSELERRLYLADVGTFAVEQILERVRQAYLDKEITGDVEEFVKAQLRTLLTDPSEGLRFVQGGPTVVMVAGVNGSGKTTSIAKLAHRYKTQGKRVLVAACDTFRAAAVDQLATWSERIGCDIVRANPGADPASVAHNACDRAKSGQYDLLIVDTAGRLHTQTDLMRELEKIRKVVARQIPGAPHEVILVLDAINGQNAITQAEMFSKAVQCTGIVLTKLDGTARGGAIFAIKQKLGLPVKFVGVGESLDDLEPFDPDSYVAALFSSA